MSDADLGKVKGTVEFEDKASDTLERIERRLEQFDERLGGVGHTIAETAAGMFTAEAALEAVKEVAHLAAEALAEITMEGAKIADVESNFKHLATEAGQLGDELIGSLREGTHSTITDFELMKRVNDNLLAGIKLTSAQYKELGTAAFGLAQAKAIDVSQALDMLDSAVLRGNDRMLKRIGIHADMEKAEIQYALALGTTVDKLSQDEKMEARRQAVLEAVSKVTGRLGEQTDGLDERVDQLRVTWQNFEEDLGKTVATSPVIMALFDGIKDGIAEAFGNDKEALVKNIAAAIESGVIALVGWSETALEAVAAGGYFAATIVRIIDNSLAGIDALGYMTTAMLGMNKASDDFYNRMAANQAAFDAEGKKRDEWAQATGRMKDKLEELRQKMIDAQANHAKLAAAHEEGAKTADDQAKAENKLGREIQLTGDALKGYIESWITLNQLGQTYESTLSEIKPELKASATYFAELGATVQDIAAAFPALSKAQAQAVVDSVKNADAIRKVWLETDQIISKSHGDNINIWVSLENRKYEETVRLLKMTGKATDEMLNAEAAKHHATVEAEIQSREEQIETSRAFYEKQYSDAKNKLDLMLNDMAAFTAADIRLAQQDAQEKERQLNHWYQYANEKIDGNLKKTQESMSAQQKDVIILASEWDLLGGKIDKTTEKVRTLSGEVLTLKEYEERQLKGSSQDVTASNLSEKLNSYQEITSAGPQGIQSTNPLVGMDESAKKLAKMGYSFQEIIDILVHHKPAGPPVGPRIPGFKEGGAGDFGSGTLAMLHGKEIVMPVEKLGKMGGDTHVTIVFENVNGSGRQVAREAADHLFSTIKQTRFIGGSR